MENFIKTLESIKTRPVRISVTTRGEQIQQTDRNILKKDIMKARFEDMKNIYPYTYESEDGILIEVENDSVSDNITNDTGSGAITIALDIKIMGLEHSAELESQNYAEIQSAKAAKKAEQEKKKSAKIAKDKKAREEKNRKEGE